MPNPNYPNDSYEFSHVAGAVHFENTKDCPWSPQDNIQRLSNEAWERTCEEALKADHLPLTNSPLVRCVESRVQDGILNLTGNIGGIMYSQVVGWRTSQQINHLLGEDHPKAMSVLCVTYTEDGKICLRPRGKMGDWDASMLELPGGFVRATDGSPQRAIQLRLGEDYNHPEHNFEVTWFGMMESARIGERVILSHTILPSGYNPPDAILLSPDDLMKQSGRLSLPSFSAAKFFLQQRL